MDVVKVFGNSSSSAPHAPACERVAVGGIQLHMYGLPKASSADAPLIPVRVMFVLHWRAGDAEKIRPMCEAIAALSTPATHIIAVTFDMRNHGTRLVESKANYSWREPTPDGRIERNMEHAYEMYAVQYGSAKDVSFLIDVLPPFLQARGLVAERWGVAGISLGAHAALIAVANEERLDVAVSIVGCADYETLMTGRYERLQQHEKTVPPFSVLFPSSMRAMLQQVDPVHRVAQHPLSAKLLFLAGGEDKLVPVQCSQKFFDVVHEQYKQRDMADRVRCVVDPPATHECSQLMAQECMQWIGRWWL
ncbi:hypothetical protein RI367_005750 [Sorochytrium milnesiophthora]